MSGTDRRPSAHGTPNAAPNSPKTPIISSPPASATPQSAPAAPAPAPDVAGVNRELLTAIVVFSFSAVGMTTGNKVATEKMKVAGAGLPSTLVLIQMVATVVLLLANYKEIDQKLLSWRVASKWLIIFFWSGSGMYTSAKSFVYVSVSFVIIMRNVGTLLTTFVEWYVRKQPVSSETLLSEVVILSGIIMYGYEMVVFKDFWKGVFWCTANTVCITIWSVTLKYKMDNDPDIKAMNKFIMSFYNNLMGIPYMLVIAATTGEVNYWSGLFMVDGIGWTVILVTCVIGYMISTSGFALTKLVSATTFQVVSNLCKVLNILLGLAFLDDKFPGWTSVLGCTVALGGGGWYSYIASQEKERGHIEPFKPTLKFFLAAIAPPLVCASLISIMQHEKSNSLMRGYQLGKA